MASARQPPRMAPVYGDIYEQCRSLTEIFKNALCYTLAFTIVSRLQESNEEDIILVCISIFIAILFAVVIKTQTEKVINIRATTLYSTFFMGPIQCILFLLEIVCNILTQFLSTLVSRYVLTWPPAANPVKDILPISVLSLVLFWALMYSIGAIHTRNLE